jgi:hypothetical protein
MPADTIPAHLEEMTWAGENAQTGDVGGLFAARNCRDRTGAGLLTWATKELLIKLFLLGANVRNDADALVVTSDNPGVASTDRAARVSTALAILAFRSQPRQLGASSFSRPPTKRTIVPSRAEFSYLSTTRCSNILRYREDPHPHEKEQRNPLASRFRQHFWRHEERNGQPRRVTAELQQ